MPEFWDVYDAERKYTGRVHTRGEPLPPGDYHLVVHVWVLNSRGEFFTTLRSPEKDYLPNMWEACGGSATAGEDSLTAALREFREETGITLRPECGERVIAYCRHESDFVDVWLFRQDMDVNDFMPRPGETVQARWATPEEILRMMAAGEYCNTTYIHKLFGIARRPA